MTNRVATRMGLIDRGVLWHINDSIYGLLQPIEEVICRPLTPKSGQLVKIKVKTTS